MASKDTDPDKWKKSQKLQVLIANLKLHGNLQKACEVAKCNRIYVWERRQTDPVFALAFDDAKKCGLEVLKDEAHRRAYQGVMRSIYHKGESCGLVREYSDTLLMFLIKQADPSYREHYQVDVGSAAGRPLMFQMMLHPDAVKQVKA